MFNQVGDTDYHCPAKQVISAHAQEWHAACVKIILEQGNTPDEEAEKVIVGFGISHNDQFYLWCSIVVVQG